MKLAADEIENLSRGKSNHEEFARAIEHTVRQQDAELVLELVEALKRTVAIYCQDTPKDVDVALAHRTQGKEAANG